MGLAQGKLTIPHVEDKMKTEKTSEPVQIESIKETASQLVNGDANAMYNVPSIDEAIEEADTLKDSSHVHSTVADSTTESIPNGDQSVANGTIGSTESTTGTDHSRKKSKNPLTWIKRRLSKKSNEAGEPSPDRAAVSKDAETPTAEKPEESLISPDTQASSYQTLAKQVEITEAAISLVDEVLSSALTAQTEEVVEHNPVTEATEAESEVASAHSVNDESPTNMSSEPADQHEHESASPEVTSEAQPCLVNGDHRAEENIDTSAELNPLCPDTKSPKQTEPESEVDHPVHEALTNKLANMELTNGHSHELPNGGTFDSEMAAHSETAH